MTTEEFDATLKEIADARFARFVVGRPQAISEYGEIYRLFTVVISQFDDGEIDPELDCSDEALLGGFTAWLDKLKRRVPEATTLVWRVKPERHIERDFERAARYYKLRARAHVLTEEAWGKGPLTNAVHSVSLRAPATKE